MIGAGRIAGGFVSPLLRAAGWEVMLACRNPEVCAVVNARGGLLLRFAGEPPDDRWIDGVTALSLDDGALADVVARADLLATAVGPSSLTAVGRMLGPLLGARLAMSSGPLNLIAFENHRRAPELLTLGLLGSHPLLAGEIGRRLGISGAAVWRTVSRREVTDAGLRFTADHTDECCVDAVSLVGGAAPAHGSVPGLGLVRAFDDRIVEKLWLFNAGHATAAYLGWQAGCATMAAALARPEIRAATLAVLRETQQAFDAYLAGRPGSSPIPHRSIETILDHYADPALQDPVTRVAREPRRKLAADDRLIGPALACLAAGIRPTALATAAAAALAYREPTDQQAVDLQRELELVGPAEVLAAVSTLDPQDELVRLVVERYAGYLPREASV